MNRYIDKDKLISDLKADKWIAENSLKYVLQDINEQPEADVAEVVRCKDCKYYGLSGCNNHSFGLRVSFGNDYCSYGERKENEQ